MEDPVADISQVIRSLTQSPPSQQRATLETYFAPNASFTHPFCRTGSFEGSRWLIWCIYRWYKIMSPRIELEIDSIAYDEQHLKLYVQMHQVFRIWAVPFYSVRASLVTVLQLVQTRPFALKSQRTTYLIQSQNDLYQTNEFVKFISPVNVLSSLLLVFQFVATAVCVLGAMIFWPVSWVEQNVLGGNKERTLADAIRG